MGSVVVVVPIGAPDATRDRLWDWCRPRYRYQVVEGLLLTEPWIKARALMPAIEDSEADIIVVADADVWCHGLTEAVQAVENGATWALPHKNVHRLSEDATTRLLAGEDIASVPLEQEPYYGTEGGGILVAKRETLLKTPVDPRFIGWGQEDMAWGMTLRHLHGPPTRLDYPLYHLWHPHPERAQRKWGSKESWLLFRRYQQARRTPDAIENLLEEARESLNLTEYSLHAD